MSLFDQLNKRVRKTFDLRSSRWLKKRIPATQSISLSAKNIFILPTGFGFAFLGFILLIFLLGTNYNNNVILLFSYLLGSFFITTMLHSFFNLSGLVLSHQHENKGFAEQVLLIPLILDSKKSRYHLLFAFAEHESERVNELKAGRTIVNIPFYPDHRGMNKPGRLKLLSEYSFGLFKTWTQLDLSVFVLAYPNPVKISKRHSLDLSGKALLDKTIKSSPEQYVKGQEDFYALGPYQLGQPLSHVAWKQVARGQGWLSKQYQQDIGNDIWLSLDNMPGSQLETKLSMLCYLAIELNKKGESFGLSLAGLNIEPSSDNQQHLREVLLALANFQKKKATVVTEHPEGNR